MAYVKIPKKQMLLGIVCLASAILSNLPVVSAIIVYLAFCLCSFALMKSKKTLGIVAVLTIGFVGLPLFDFIYSRFTTSFMTSLPFGILVLLVQAVVYFGLFILVNSWIRKEKFAFSAPMGILTVICIAIYSLLEGSRSFTLVAAMNQTIGQGALLDWLNVLDGGNAFVGIISEIAFFAALWCISIRFIEEGQ